MEREIELSFGHLKSLLDTQVGRPTRLRGKILTEVNILQSSVYRRYLESDSGIVLTTFSTNTSKNRKKLQRKGKRHSQGGETGILKIAA